MASTWREGPHLFAADLGSDNDFYPIENDAITAKGNACYARDYDDIPCSDFCNGTLIPSSTSAVLDFQ